MFLTGYLHANVALQWMYSNQKRLLSRARAYSSVHYRQPSSASRRGPHGLILYRSHSVNDTHTALCLLVSNKRVARSGPESVM